MILSQDSLSSTEFYFPVRSLLETPKSEEGKVTLQVPISSDKGKEDLRFIRSDTGLRISVNLPTVLSSQDPCVVKGVEAALENTCQV